MAYNEYSTRFFFRFESNAGREFRIDIKKRNYTGVAEQRHLGQTPVLKRENGNSGIYGTSLEIYAECRIDGEFAELYTSDAKEFLVVLSEVSNGATTAIWHGFNTPELYAEPEVAPPYDVQIIATDGLGELKLYNFQPAGRQTLFYFIQNLLQYSGLAVSQSDVIVVDSLSCVTPSVTAPNLLTGIQVNLDYLAAEGKSCYDVLSSLLTTLNLTLARYADKWLIARESDIEINGGSVYGRTVSGTEVALPVAQYGSMRNHRWYPVGRIDTDIEPAKNSLTVALAYARRTMLENADLVNGSGWIYPEESIDNTSHYVTWMQIADGLRPELINFIENGSVTIRQEISVAQFDGRLTLRVLTMQFGGYTKPKYKVFLRVAISDGTNIRFLNYHENGNYCEWVSSSTEIKYEEQVLSGYSSSAQIPISAFNAKEFTIPGIPITGTLGVFITAKRTSFFSDPCDFFLGGVYLSQDAVPGYKDTIVIDNGARGSAGDAVSVFGDAPYTPNGLKNVLNVTADGNGVITTDWQTSKFGGELLSVIAMDYALSVALPRLKAHGTVNVPSGADNPIAFVNPDGIPMLIMTSGWKLAQDDLDVELISCPAAEIDILSQSIRELTEEEAAAIGGSTSSAGSGGRSYIPVTQPQYFVPIEAEGTDEIESIKALYDISIIQTEADEEHGIEEVVRNITEVLRHLFIVNNNGTKYLRTDISFYSDQAVSAGGISEGGGGGTGGGITADGMWALLAASTQEQIDASHLSQALGGYATQAWVLAQGFGTITKESIIEALEYTPVAPDDLLPFASGLASAISRLDALEYWLTRPVLEDLALTSLHVDRTIDLGGLVLEYDYANNAWHLQGNIYADGFVSAGGMSATGSGTGGGITADGMWALLAASTQEQIDASHLSQALGDYATQAWVLAQGFGTITKESIIEALEYTPVASDDLLPFASGLASATSRLDALEYWLTRPVLEDLALTSLHVDRTIDLGGLVLEYDYTNDAWHLNGNFYADGFVSAGGMSATGSGTGGGIDANAMWTLMGDGTQEQINLLHLTDALSNYALKTWVSAQGYLTQSQMWSLLDAPSGERIDASHLALSLGTGGNYISNVSLATNETTGKKILTFSRGTLPTYVSRVAMSVPTGFSVSGSPITSSGTLALSFSSGYSLPTTAKQANWDTAYGWGDHAQAGYAKADSLMAVATATAGATARLRALEYWLTRPVLEDLELTSLHVERTIDLGGLTLEYDYAVSAWHLNGNFYADGFVSAGGYSGSSSEGGINTTAMWRLLAAATSEQISASHLSTALDGYATQEWVRAQGYSLTAEAIAIALNYVPVSPDDLVTLAAADATAAARISAIEYWLTRPVLEDLALTSLHVDRTIDLGGLVLEYDYANNAWHLQGSIYADGFVSAGGMSATASGGGISATAMWNLLDDATTEQINASHLSTALATYATQAWVQALGYTTATNMWSLLAAATSEHIAASHLPISVSQGSGSYVTGISYSGGTFYVSRANISIPTLLPNPYALSFGSKSYDGSAARTITAADLGAITGNQAITLAGDVMGSGTTYITTTIGTGVVTNAMLAGSIANGKLANSSISLAGRSVSLGGSITASTMRSDLSISNVENTALSSWAGTTNITKVGTITTGTWHGSAIANSYLANSSITLAGRSVSLGGSITAANMLSDLGLSGVVGDISTLQGYFTSGKANYAVADGDGNTISSTYLKLSGGTMTGDLHMGSSYGRRIYFGDGSYCYIGEISDDVMSIYGDKGINILTASSSRAVSVGSSSVATPLYVYGRLYLTASAYLEYSSSAIHATAGFYSDSFISAGGISTSSDARLKEDIEGISAGKAWKVLADLRPVTFRWKVDHRRAAGYIAQEVERVLPEAVTEAGGIKRLQYDILFTYGMAALGGLRLQQETQEQKIARLERRVEFLERKMTA